MKIVKALQDFHSDSAQKETFITCHSAEEEALAHQLAGHLLLGRESKVEKLSTISIVGVRVWKPILHMCSTTREAEALAVGPFGGEAGSFRGSAEILSETVTDVAVLVSITYFLSPAGDVSVIFMRI